MNGKSMNDEYDVDENCAAKEIAEVDANQDSAIRELGTNDENQKHHASKPILDEKEDDLSLVPKFEKTNPGHLRLKTWANFDNQEGKNKTEISRNRCQTFDNIDLHTHNRYKSLDKVDLTLNDISNPLENEAENAIIRALETRQWEAHDSDEDLRLLKAGKIESSYPYPLETKTPSGSTESSTGTTTLQDLSAQLNIIGGKGGPKGLGQIGYLSRAKSNRRLSQDATGGQQINELEHMTTSQKSMIVDLPVVDILDEEAQYHDSQVLQKSNAHADHVVINDSGSALTPTNKTTTTNEQTRNSSVWNNDLFGRNNLKTKRLFENSKEMVEELHWSLRFKSFLKLVLLYTVIPGLIISAILFYAAGNPMVGGVQNFEVTPNDTSYSWWILFIVRQVIILCLAKITEIFVIEILTIRLRTFQLRLGSFGSFVALSLIQSRGWPYIITFWAILDFCFLQGDRKFAKHWLYYYSNIRWFKTCKFVRENFGIVNGQFIPPDIRLEGTVTDCNPAGNVVSSELYKQILIGAIILGCAVTLKRVIFGIYVGKKATETYTPQLEKLMAKMVIIGEVAQLAKEIFHDPEVRRCASQYKTSRSRFNLKNVSSDESVSDHDGSVSEDSVEDEVNTQSIQLEKDSKHSAFLESTTQLRTDTNGTDVMDEVSIVHEQCQPVALEPTSRKFPKQKISELVGEWEEPAVIRKKSREDRFSIRDVLEFRRAVYGLDKRHPFSYAFGPADTREACLESAKKVYGRLLLYTPDDSKLPFDTISLIAMKANGEIDEKKLKKVIRMFRPNHHGYIGALAFLKSCDKAYKQLRTLRAAIINSSQIDKAFEKIVNIVFYFAIILVLLAIVRVDPWPVIASSSAFLLGFSFMFSKAASKYFDGILLILVQKPFDIGDRVHLSDPSVDTSSSGAATWIVEEVALHSTTLRFATTNEVATFSNGVLADLRIINANRSPSAVVYIYNKFASDVPFEKVMVFKSAIESFVTERPNQWAAMNGFRSTRLEADRGFIEYVIVLTHVEKWQNIVAILTSKAELSSYCLEVQKQLGMRYEAPPLPVNLDLDSRSKTSSVEQYRAGKTQEDISQPDFDKLANWFASSETKKMK